MLLNIEKMDHAFDSRTVASKLKIPVAEASRGLMRLRKMGFLKRDRIGRLCRNGSSNCRRGLQYLYSISKQGKSYLEWLGRHGPGDLLLQSLPWMQVGASSITGLNFALKAPQTRLSKFKPSRPRQLRDSVIEFLAKEQLEFLNKLRKDEDEIENLYALLGRSIMKLEDEKRNRSKEIEKAINNKDAERMKLELKLRCEHVMETFERSGRRTKVLKLLSEIIRVTFGAGILVNNSVVIPREAFVKAVRIISAFERNMVEP